MEDEKRDELYGGWKKGAVVSPHLRTVPINLFSVYHIFILFKSHSCVYCLQFKPEMEDEKRDELYGGWKKAVNAAMAFK
jgi:thioredoxin-related protein